MTESLINNLYEKNINSGLNYCNKNASFLDGFIVFLSFYRLKFSVKNINYSKFIVKNKNICNGKPTIKGTRITTETIFNTFIKQTKKQKSSEDCLEIIKKEYPSLGDEKYIMIALLYYISHISYKKFKNEIITR